MMNARLGWLLIGCVIGFILGYIVRSLREIKDKVEKVDQHVTKQNHDTDEFGFISVEWMRNLALLVVVALVAYSAFASQKASNDVKHQQDHSAHEVTCLQVYLTKTIGALNARTAYSQEQTDANVKLQKAQLDFLQFLLHKPPPAPAESEAVAATYIKALTTYTIATAKSSAQIAENPYPTKSDFTDCLKKD